MDTPNQPWHSQSMVVEAMEKATWEIKTKSTTNQRMCESGPLSGLLTSETNQSAQADEDLMKQPQTCRRTSFRSHLPNTYCILIKSTAATIPIFFCMSTVLVLHALLGQAEREVRACLSDSWSQAYLAKLSNQTHTFML